MKIIPSRDLRVRPGGVWKDLREHRELVITSHGRPVAMMVPVAPDNVEETLRAVRRARGEEAISAVRARRAGGGGAPSGAEVDEIVRRARKAGRG